MARAMSSLPVPVSPSITTVESVGATVRTSCRVLNKGSLEPTFFAVEQSPISLQKNQRERHNMNPSLSILNWYRILRGHYHWPLFQAIRYALWLAR
jgi:hypothetical protein